MSETRRGNSSLGEEDFLLFKVPKTAAREAGNVSPRPSLCSTKLPRYLPKIRGATRTMTVFLSKETTDDSKRFPSQTLSNQDLTVSRQAENHQEGKKKAHLNNLKEYLEGILLPITANAPKSFRSRGSVDLSKDTGGFPVLNSAETGFNSSGAN